MAARYVLKQSKKGEFFFTLLASNGQHMLSSDIYASKPSALECIASARDNGVIAAQFVTHKAKDGRFYFTLQSSSGQVIGCSEMYRMAKARDSAIAVVMRNAGSALLDDQSDAL